MKPRLGSSWLELLSRDFTLGPSVVRHWNFAESIRVPKKVTYSVGQPMGALSSWPFMAYVHHRIVWYAFGGRKFAKGGYLILGDDVVIFDKVAYGKYLRILSRLGIVYTNS
jgi:hypothetical protein